MGYPPGAALLLRRPAAVPWEAVSFCIRGTVRSAAARSARLPGLAYGIRPASGGSTPPASGRDVSGTSSAPRYSPDSRPCRGRRSGSVPGHRCRTPAARGRLSPVAPLRSGSFRPPLRSRLPPAGRLGPVVSASRFPHRSRGRRSSLACGGAAARAAPALSRFNRHALPPDPSVVPCLSAWLTTATARSITAPALGSCGPFAFAVLLLSVACSRVGLAVSPDRFRFAPPDRRHGSPLLSPLSTGHL